MRTKFTTHGSGAVTVEYIDPETDIKECRTFASFGRYVYELLGMDGRRQQVCDGLQSRGSTLMVETGADILPIIRREHAKMMRKAKARANA